jgi:hypothetical protein
MDEERQCVLRAPGRRWPRGQGKDKRKEKKDKVTRPALRLREITFESSTTRCCALSSKKQGLRVPEEWTRAWPSLTRPALLKEIDSVVVAFSKAAVVSSLVLDRYVRLCHASGQRMGMRAAIRQSMTAGNKGARLGRKTKASADAASEAGGTLMRKAAEDVAGKAFLETLQVPGQVIDFASNAFWTTTMLIYCRDVLWNHVSAAIRARFGDLTKPERESVLDAVREDADEVAGPKDGKHYVLAQQALLWLRSKESLWDALRSYCVCSAGDLQTPEQKDALMEAATLTRIELLSEMEERALTDPELRRRFKSFHLIPQFQARRHFIKIDARVLRSLLRRWCKADGSVPASRKRARDLEADDSGAAKTARVAPKAGRTNRISVPTRRDDGTSSFEWKAPPSLARVPPEEWKTRKEWVDAFVSSVEVAHVFKPCKRDERKAFDLPKQIATDGMQLHVGYKYRYAREIPWPEGKDLPKKPLDPARSDRPSTSSSDFTRFSTGLFDAKCLRLQHLEQIGCGRLHFVDPGAANVFTVLTVGTNEWKACEGQVSKLCRRPEARGMKRAQYYARIGATQHCYRGDAAYAGITRGKTKRRMGWRPDAVSQAYDRLAAEGSLKVGDCGKALAAARLRFEEMTGPAVWPFVTSRTHARLRFQRYMNKEHALGKLVEELCPSGRNDGTDVVVVGNWTGRNAVKGECMRSPVKTLRRCMARSKRVVVLDEFNTSCKCNACGPVKGPECEKVEHPKRQRELKKKAWAKRVERKEERAGRALSESEKKELRRVERRINGISICPHCEKHWSRDVNACCNFSCCFYAMCTKAGNRPSYLERPKDDSKVAGADARTGPKSAPKVAQLKECPSEESDATSSQPSRLSMHQLRLS